MTTLQSPKLTRQERIDIFINRALPRLTARGHRFVLGLTRGRIGSRKRGIPVGLLTTIGARSGKPRTVPLMYLRDEDRYLVVGANSGQDRHPAWFHNLRTHPNAVFCVGGHRHQVHATVITGTERAIVWPRLVRHNPLWAGFQEYTERESPVVALEPQSEELHGR